MSYIQHLNGSGLNYIADYEKTLQSLSSEDVQRMAQKILADGNRVTVVMRPEAKETK